MSAHVETKRFYILVCLALLGLLALTVGLSFVDLGGFNTPAALLIAAAKALLVALCFMHLRHEDGLTRLIAGVGVFWLEILLLLTFCDYLSRGWLVGG